MAQNVQKSFDSWQTQLESYLNEKNTFTDLLEKVEKQTGVKRTYIVLGLVAVLLLWLVFGYGAHLLCQFVGFAWPAYQSIKAIESHNKDDDTKWLTYWVVYSTFSLAEFFTDIFLWWIPLYWFFKCCFLIYCMAPTNWNGSVTIYNNLIRPFVLKNQKKIEEAIDTVQDAAQNVLDGATKAAGDAASEVVRRNIAEKSE